jgi:hypothetical protein
MSFVNLTDPQADWDAINEKKVDKAKADAATDEMKID